MKNDNVKIALVGVLSLLIAVGTLVGAAVLAHINSRDFSSDETESQQSEAQHSSSISSVITSSEQNLSQESEPDQSIFNIETGIYTNDSDSIVVTSADAGFIEGNINCGGITMEFSGQMIENTLTATGTDSLNNTVEITLVFENNTITAISQPLIQYEEASDYLILSGVFAK